MIKALKRLYDVLSGNTHALLYKQAARQALASAALKEVDVLRGVAHTAKTATDMLAAEMKELKAKFAVEQGYSRGLAEEIRRTDDDLINLAHEVDTVAKQAESNTEDLIRGAAARNAIEETVSAHDHLHSLHAQVSSEVASTVGAHQDTLETHARDISALIRAVFPLPGVGTDGTIRRVNDPHSAVLWDGFRAIWDALYHADHCSKCSGFSNCEQYVALYERALDLRIKIVPFPWKDMQEKYEAR